MASSSLSTARYYRGRWSCSAHIVLGVASRCHKASIVLVYGFRASTCHVLLNLLQRSATNALTSCSTCSNCRTYSVVMPDCLLYKWQPGWGLASVSPACLEVEVTPVLLLMSLNA